MSAAIEIYRDRTVAGKPLPREFTKLTKPQNKSELLARAGLTSLAAREGNNCTSSGFPILATHQFADICEVFPCAYLHGLLSGDWTARFMKRTGIDNVRPIGTYLRRWEDYDFHEGMPIDVCRIVIECLEGQYFPSIEIRTPEYLRTAALDPLLLGIMPSGDRALIARWGSAELLSMQQIHEIANIRRSIARGFGIEWLDRMRVKKARAMYPQYAEFITM